MASVDDLSLELCAVSSTLSSRFGVNDKFTSDSVHNLHRGHYRGLLNTAKMTSPDVYSKEIYKLRNGRILNDERRKVGSQEITILAMPLTHMHLNLHRNIKRLKNRSFGVFDRFLLAGEGQTSVRERRLQQHALENATKREECLSNNDRHLGVSNASVITSIHCW